MGEARVLRTARAVLTRTFAVDEMPVDATGAVTVKAIRLDGTEVDSQSAAGPDAQHVYTYTFPGRDVLDDLLIQWTATVAGDTIILDQDRLRVVGGFYFSLSEGRGVDTVLSSASKYPTARLVAARIETEDEAERICGQAFVPRFARETLDGTGASWLRLRWPVIRAIRSISVRSRPQDSYQAMTTDQLAAVAYGRDGVVRLDAGIFWPNTGVYWGGIWPVGRSNIIVEYEHGEDYPDPDLVRGAKIRFKSLVLQPTSALPDRAERIATSETGIVILASPSQDKTGIPEVDACYARHASPRPGFG